MPRGPLGRAQLGNLRVYEGAEHPHAAQQPDVARRRRAEPQECEERLIMAETMLFPRTTSSQRGRRRRARGAAIHVQKLDEQGRAYATGKRKNAIARVWIKPGTGKITVNGRDLAVYFARPVLRMMIAAAARRRQPRTGQFDVIVTVAGGGLSGQAGAVRHGISKALTYYEPDLRARAEAATAS